jgi:hypothetical protein
MSKINILTGKVAAILNSRELAINIGMNAGVEVDMVFKVLGEAKLSDPDTNEQLGSIRYEKGKVKIVTVEEKFSTARTFETYVTNIGGVGTVGDISTSFNLITEASRNILSPQKFVTRVQTLKYDESGIDLPERTDKEFIYIKRGDIVEIDTENKLQKE